MLAEYLNPILSLLITNKYTVKNSFDCAEKVVNYDHNLYVASLDVESLLFTNIHLEEWNKLLRTVSTTYFPIISIVINRKDLYNLLKLETTGTLN